MTDQQPEPLTAKQIAAERGEWEARKEGLEAHESPLAAWALATVDHLFATIDAREKEAEEDQAEADQVFRNYERGDKDLREQIARLTRERNDARNTINPTTAALNAYAEADKWKKAYLDNEGPRLSAQAERDSLRSDLAKALMDADRDEAELKADLAKAQGEYKRMNQEFAFAAVALADANEQIAEQSRALEAGDEMAKALDGLCVMHPALAAYRALRPEAKTVEPLSLVSAHNVECGPCDAIELESCCETGQHMARPAMGLPELESPNFTLKEMQDFATRDYQRVNHNEPDRCKSRVGTCSAGCNIDGHDHLNDHALLCGNPLPCSRHKEAGEALNSGRDPGSLRAIRERQWRVGSHNFICTPAADWEVCKREGHGCLVCQRPYSAHPEAGR